MNRVETNLTGCDVTERTEEVPCGTCTTTTYTRSGQLVRQDVHVVVSEEAMAQGMRGMTEGD